MVLKAGFLGCVIVVFGLLFATEAHADKTVDGTWTWVVKGRRDRPDHTVTAKLVAAGGKVTGTVTMQAGREAQVRDGKIDGKTITFQVVREFRGKQSIAKYSGTLNGDTIAGEIESDRNGTATKHEWKATRSK